MQEIYLLDKNGKKAIKVFSKQAKQKELTNNCHYWQPGYMQTMVGISSCSEN